MSEDIQVRVVEVLAKAEVANMLLQQRLEAAKARSIRLLACNWALGEYYDRLTSAHDPAAAFAVSSDVSHATLTPYDSAAADGTSNGGSCCKRRRGRPTDERLALQLRGLLHTADLVITAPRAACSPPCLHVRHAAAMRRTASGSGSNSSSGGGAGSGSQAANTSGGLSAATALIDAPDPLPVAAACAAASGGAGDEAQSRPSLHAAKRHCGGKSLKD